jgi:hypothetical protein
MLQSPVWSFTVWADFWGAEFGLIPKISTPVQKPVENRVIRQSKRKKCFLYSHILKGESSPAMI